MKYLILKPRGAVNLGDSKKPMAEIAASSIQSKNSFIQQQIGRHAIKIHVGDYVFWISDPSVKVKTEDGEVVINDTIDMTCNLLINETLFAFGNVVVTANHRVDNDEFKGLADQDIANIMNSFTLSTAALVYDEKLGKEVAVDRIRDAILAPNGISQPTNSGVRPIIEYIDDEPEKIYYEN